jgi:phosphatidylglycerophosphatase C
MRLAVFDLDGTITRHDTLVPYALGFVVRRRFWRLPALLLVLPAVIGNAIGVIDRGGLKSAFIRATLGGCRREDLERWTATFIKRLEVDGFFSQAIEAVRIHARAGDRLVLLSASTDLYVPAIGQALGFQEVICTGVRWDGEHLAGTLTTPNRRGEEKARCVTALRARYPGVPSAAYGNAASDIAHLKLVEQGVLVNGSAAARRQAARAGIVCTEWR